MLGPMEEAKSSTHSYGAIVTPSFAFGLDMACKNCLWHVDGDKVMWSVGGQMAMFNTHSQEARFVPLADRGARALILTVAANHKYFAVAERVPGVEHDQVSVYALGSDKRAKVLPHDPGVSRAESGKVECLHFSENSKYLLVQYGTPDWTLVVWRWYNGKILASHRVETRPVLSAQFSAVDDTVLAAMTPTCLLQYRLDLDREVLKQVAAPQTWEPFRMSAMCWIAGSMLAVVGAGGDVAVYQEGITRLSTRVDPLPPPEDPLAAAAAARAAAAAQRAAEAAAEDPEGPLEADGSSASVGADGGGGSGSGGASTTAGPGVAGAPPEEHLLAVTARGRGFVAAGMSGTVYFFEPPAMEQKKSGVRDLFVVVRRLPVDLPPPPELGPGGYGRLLALPHPPPSHLGHHSHRQAPAGLSLLPPGISDAAWPTDSRPVVRLSISSGDEEVVALSVYGDVMVASMPLVLEREEKPIADVVGPEILEGEPFSRLLGGFLTGRVVGLAAASLQPLIAAASSDDRQLRVWNYDARRCVASLGLEDEPQCLDLHPGGGLLLVGLPDKVKMYNVLLDALDQVFEVALKRPGVVRFSSGGGLFAAVGRTHAIFLHATYQGQPQLAVLKAHTSSVYDLAFARDDRLMVSVGQGGAVYFWDMSTFTRVMDLELVDKQALYLSAAVHTSEHGAVAVRAADGRVQQIYNGRVTYELTDCRGGYHSPCCLLGADKVFLAADEYGGVVSYSWPSDLPPRPGFAALAPQPFPCHLHSAAGGGISRMAMVGPRGLLFTAHPDGTILMSNVALVIDGALLEAGAHQGGAAARRQALSHSRLSFSNSQRRMALQGAGASQISVAAPSVSGGAVTTSGAAGGGSAALSAPPFFVTVNEERLVALRDKVLEVAMRVGSAKSDAEYQAFRSTQVLREAVAQLEGELASTRAVMADRERRIRELQESSQRHERQIVKELEGAHMSAAEELEALYEKRLQVEAEKVRVMAASRDDWRYRGEEDLRRLQQKHALEIEALKASHATALTRMEARLGEAAEARAEQDRFFNEYVNQAEEDFEDHSDRINERVHSLAEAAEAREQRLKADLNILKRTNLRLKADKSIDMKRMEKLTTDNATLREQTEDLRLTVAKMQRELEERDTVNADNYATVQQLRRKVQDLEKHKFVLSYKADMYAKNLEPQEHEIARLQEELEGHGRELQGQVTRTQLLSRHVAEKDASLRTAKAELATFKRRCELQEAAITAFSQDLYAAMQQPDDRSLQGRSARQKALDDLVRKYCLGDPRANANRSAAQEAIAAAAAAETRAVLLQWRLDQDGRTARATQRTALNQNSQLLRELQVAQQDNRALKDRFEAAVASLRELEHRYAVLERKAGLRTGRITTDLLGKTGTAAEYGIAADELGEYGAAEGSGIGGGDDDLAGSGGGGGGGSATSVSSPAGAPRGPLSRGLGAGPGAGLTPSGNGAQPRPGTARVGNHHNHHNANRPGAVRPGTAGPGRPPSAGWGAHRSVGGPPPPPRGGGAAGVAGGGAPGVARGAPLRAFAELITVERQRMAVLASQLESGAAVAVEQQRALMGLRDQLVAAAAAAGEEEGEGEESGPGEGKYDREEEGVGAWVRSGSSGPSGLRGGEGGSGGGESGAGGRGSGLRSQGSSGGEEGGAGGQEEGGGGDDAVRRSWREGGGGLSQSYHAPGVLGLPFGGNSAGSPPSRPAARFSPHPSRPLTAASPASDAALRRSTASPSTIAGGHRMTPGSARLRASTGSPATLAGGVTYGTTGRGGGGGGRAVSPTGGRNRPSSAGGVGLRAFTDEKLDRFRPPQPSVREDLPL